MKWSRKGHLNGNPEADSVGESSTVGPVQNGKKGVMRHTEAMAD